VLISGEEEGTLTQDPNVNAEPYALKKSARLNVSNETRKEFRGVVRWSLRRPDASVIREGSCAVTVPALSAAWLEKMDFSGENTRESYFAYSLEDEAGCPAGSGTVLFCAPKHFRFEDPKLTAQADGDQVTVTAQAYARSVEIQCGADTVLEDNFFDMNGGTRRIRILRGKAEDVRVRSVYDIR
jgi:beta-mannosidase